MLTASEFWTVLQSNGIELTSNYTSDGLTRFCKKPDGETIAVSVHSQYPEYVVDKVLEEAGIGAIPLYNNYQQH